MDFIEGNQVSGIISCLRREDTDTVESNLDVPDLEIMWLATPFEKDIDDENSQVGFFLFLWETLSSGLFNFIESRLTRGDSVVIASYNGYDRAPYVALVYLMRRYNWGCQKSAQFLETKCAPLDGGLSNVISKRVNVAWKQESTDSWECDAGRIIVGEQFEDGLWADEVVQTCTFFNSLSSIHPLLRWSDHRTELSCQRDEQKKSVKFDLVTSPTLPPPTRPILKNSLISERRLQPEFRLASQRKARAVSSTISQNTEGAPASVATVEHSRSHADSKRVDAVMSNRVPPPQPSPKIKADVEIPEVPRTKIRSLSPHRDAPAKLPLPPSPPDPSLAALRVPVPPRSSAGMVTTRMSWAVPAVTASGSRLLRPPAFYPLAKSPQIPEVRSEVRPFLPVATNPTVPQARPEVRSQVRHVGVPQARPEVRRCPLVPQPRPQVGVSTGPLSQKGLTRMVLRPPAPEPTARIRLSAESVTRSTTSPVVNATLATAHTRRTQPSRLSAYPPPQSPAYKQIPPPRLIERVSLPLPRPVERPPVVLLSTFDRPLSRWPETHSQVPQPPHLPHSPLMRHPPRDSLVCAASRLTPEKSSRRKTRRSKK